MPQKVLQRTYSTRFNDFALEFYSFVADNYAPLYSRPIECTDRDAPFVLDGVLYHESDLDLEEHYTDTHGYTEIVRSPRRRPPTSRTTSPPCSPRCLAPSRGEHVTRRRTDAPRGSPGVRPRPRQTLFGRTGGRGRRRPARFGRHNPERPIMPDPAAGWSPPPLGRDPRAAREL